MTDLVKGAIDSAYQNAVAQAFGVLMDAYIVAAADPNRPVEEARDEAHARFHNALSLAREAHEAAATVASA